MGFTFKSLTEETWKDFVDLFGDRGACGGCWCMYWRLKASDYNQMKGDKNKKAIHQLVKRDKPTGVLAFFDKKAIGWCAVSPRNEYKRLETSRVLKPVDDQPVWSATCFFIDKNYRNKGLSKQLLKAAVDYAFSKGARIVEGYPVESKDEIMPAVFAWTGFSSAFIKAGFKEVARRSETRPVMRLYKK